MDFRHLIVTCLFSMLRLSFETQKIKENYAIFHPKGHHLTRRAQALGGMSPDTQRISIGLVYSIPVF